MSFINNSKSLVEKTSHLKERCNILIPVFIAENTKKSTESLSKALVGLIKNTLFYNTFILRYLVCHIHMRKVTFKIVS